MNCLNMENPENPQEWYGVNEHRFCTVLEVKDGKIIWPFFEYHPELWECHPEWWPVKKPGVALQKNKKQIENRTEK